MKQLSKNFRMMFVASAMFFGCGELEQHKDLRNTEAQAPKSELYVVESASSYSPKDFINRTIVLKGVKTSECLAILNSGELGNMNCQGRNAHASHWKFTTPDSDGYSKLKHHNNKCLKKVSSNGLAYDSCSGARGLKWKLITSHGFTFLIKIKGQNKCVVNNQSGELQLQTCNTAKIEQRYQIAKACHLRPRAFSSFMQSYLAKLPGYTVKLKAQSSRYYLHTDNNEKLQANETEIRGHKFKIVDLNGGRLMDGDTVFLADLNVAKFVAAERNGGGVVSGNRTNARGWETFTIKSAGRSRYISPSIGFGLKTSSGYYFSAVGGGNAEVKANRTWLRSWETFFFEQTEAPRTN